MKADMSLFRLDDICFVPLNPAVRQRVIVDGGRLLTIDVAALRRQPENYAAELRDELERIADRSSRSMPTSSEQPGVPCQRNGVLLAVPRGNKLPRSEFGRADADVSVARDRDYAEVHPVFRSVIPGDAVGL